jgi:hypothetical protein
MNTNELDQLVPAGAEVRAGGETLQIKPLKIGQVPAFLRAITPALQALGKQPVDWLALFSRHGENLLDAISVAVGKSRGWVDGLDADDAVALVATIIEVNADFFTRHLLARLDSVFTRMAERLPKMPQTAADGSTPASA